MKKALKTVEVEQTRLELFEALVYSRQHEEAGRELLLILRRLKMGAEFAGHEMNDASRPVLYTRLAAAITTLLADPGMQLSPEGFDLLAVEHAALDAVFQASAFGNSDHLVRQFGTPDPAEPFRLQFSGPHNLVKLLLSYSLDSDFELDFEAFFRAEPQLSLPAFLGMLAHTVVLTPGAHRRREKLLTLGPLFEQVELKDHMLSAVRDAYMHCSYATGEGKHGIKVSLNRMMRRLAGNRFALPEFSAQRMRKVRPTIVVQLEWFHSAHAMYRCYAPYIRRLREKFRLIAIGHERALDETSKVVFDETIELAGKTESALDVVEHIKRIAPDIVYYPSIGMNVRCVVLSNIRLAPIQIATMGHPASTRSRAIDYIVVSDSNPGKPACYSETVVLCEGMIPMVIPEGEEFPQVALEAVPPVLRIAVPAMASKLNAQFLAACRSILQKSSRPLEFHFLPAKGGVTRYQVTRQIQAWIPGAVVHPRLDYNEYLKRLNGCHLHLSPFPFGGTNSNIDSMRLGIPMVALEGVETHSQIDAAMMRHAGLPESLIACQPEEYQNIALRLIGNDAERVALAEQLRRTDIAALFLESRDRRAADDFLATLWWIYQQHEAIQANGRRFWSPADRRSLVSQLAP